jgi:zona occludens toxin (predicted ATPase)
MIYLYTGTPGSGKSYHAAKDVVHRLKRGGGLICNFPVNEDYVKKKKTKVEYWDNSELTPKRFVQFALENHKIGKEGQTLVVIDECQIKFNCRDFGRKDRNDWVNLFAQHRKLGYNFIL